MKKAARHIFMEIVLLGYSLANLLVALAIVLLQGLIFLVQFVPVVDSTALYAQGAIFAGCLKLLVFPSFGLFFWLSHLTRKKGQLAEVAERIDQTKVAPKWMVTVAMLSFLYCVSWFVFGGLVWSRIGIPEAALTVLGATGFFLPFFTYPWFLSFVEYKILVRPDDLTDYLISSEEKEQQRRRELIMKDHGAKIQGAFYASVSTLVALFGYLIYRLFGIEWAGDSFFLIFVLSGCLGAIASEAVLMRYYRERFGGKGL